MFICKYIFEFLWKLGDNKLIFIHLILYFQLRVIVYKFTFLEFSMHQCERNDNTNLRVHSAMWFSSNYLYVCLYFCQNSHWLTAPFRQKHVYMHIDRWINFSRTCVSVCKVSKFTHTDLRTSKYFDDFHASVKILVEMWFYLKYIHSY